MKVLSYKEATERFKDSDIVSAEAMGFSWRLPWKNLKKDCKTGWATVFDGTRTKI